MHKKFTKRIFLFLVILVTVLTAANAQTITVGNVDAGPYGQGSTITAPFTVDNSSGCIVQDNKFDLYLSDATGSFATETKIGSFTGFYTTFVNGVIPASTPFGLFYKVRIKSTDPATVSAPSSSFTINAVSGVVAGTASTFINTANPDVFGSCNGTDNSPYFFSNESTPGSIATAKFHNEFNNTDVATISLNGTFNARLTNYTVTVKATKGLIVGTKSYMLINNTTVNSFAINGSTTVCLDGSNNDLKFAVDISDAGIKRNYPGLLYQMDWGDGRIDMYTICDIIARGGTINHMYTSSSCGNTVGGQNNVFKVQIQPISPYCSNNAVSPITTYAKVLIPAINRFTLPPAACLGSPIPITNASDPGMDPNSSAANCKNTGALYSWLIDGNIIKQNVDINYVFDPYTYITAAGVHTITLKQQTNTSLCPAADLTQSICIQAKPVPAFSLPVNVICPETAVTPGNTSVIDNNCNNTNTYNWTITGPDNVINNTANVVFINGTNEHSQFPQFLFHTPGVYQVQLGISTASCGTVLAPAQTITVNTAPVATLSPNITLCGTNQALSFDNNNGNTKTILSGTVNENSATYTWTVTGPDNSVNNPANADFLNGTDMHSKYPQIKFKAIGTYSISVTHTNNCNTATATQVITFQLAPEIDAGPDQTICEGNQVSLTGHITDPSNSVTSYSWVGGSNNFTNGSSLNATYTPTTADINAGQVTLTLKAITSSAQCSVITNDVIINITKKDHITSANAKTICSGQNANYTITATNPATTFTWSSAVTSGTATGFTTPGTGNSINNMVTNTGNVDAVISYTITPATNGCPGTPFVFNLTVKPLPVITATVANLSICSNQPAGIALSSSVSGTTYTWVSTAAAGISGNLNSTTATATAGIQHMLTNNSTTAGNVTYTITPYNGTCPGTPVTATVTVQPSPTVAYAGPDKTLCNSAVYTLEGNTPVSGTGKWTLISGQTGITFLDDTNPTTTVNGLVQGNIYKFKWTITASPSCPATSSMVTITNTIETVGGTVTASATVCSGNNGGTLNLSGQTGQILRWEKSVDNGTNWAPVNNTTTSLNYLNLTQTTQFRAVVQNNICSIKTSAPATITVNPATVSANAGSDITTCSATSISLNGNDPAPFIGVWTQTGGPAVTIVNPNNIQTQVTGLTPGTTYKFTWTIKGLPPCTDSSDEVAVINNVETVGGSVTASTMVCSGNNGGTLTLSGQTGQVLRWEKSVDNGTSWMAIVNTTNSLNYLNLTQTTQYRAVVQSNSCSVKMSTVAVITVNQPAVIANAGIDITACGAASITLNGNNPAPFIGMWAQTGGPAATIVDPGSMQTQVTGLTPGTTYKFTWTIKGLPPCTDNSDEVAVINDVETVGGDVNASATVCSGSNAGVLNLTGQTGQVLRWEKSTDNGINWMPVINATTSLNYLNLLQSTQYRAVVQNNSCSVKMSTIAIITVNQPAIAANAGTDVVACNINSITLNGNDSGPFIGLWTQTGGPAVTISNPSNAQTSVTGLTPGNSYKFTWTIKGLPPCTDSSDEVVIVDNTDIVAGFTADKTSVCGAVSINFTNTSTPLQPGTSYLWDFGDGTSSTLVNPQHTFAPAANGADKKYDVTLTIGGNCAVRTILKTITVSPAKPVASVIPLNDSGCGSFAITANNTSPGTNAFYDFNLYDDKNQLIQTIHTTDKSPVTFNPVTTTQKKTFYITLVATNNCGVSGQNAIPVPVTISPSGITAAFFEKNNTYNGCYPLTVTLVNNSTGGDSYQYFIYNATTGTNLPPVSSLLQETTLSFPAPGRYDITIQGKNACGLSPASPAKEFLVNVAPVPDFEPNVKLSCNTLTVNFTNKTTNQENLSQSSIAYIWDFGDGSTSNLVSPTHTYKSNSIPYTVTLTAISPVSNCSAVAKKTDLINVVPLPAAQFAAKPDTIITLPNYHFDFVDQTPGKPAAWSWSFGDGSSSGGQNPGHTYADTGKYKVILTITSKQGCQQSVTHIVQVTGTPGQLYLPNAFEPASATQELRTFMAKGSGIKTWQMQIFDNWGKLLWETTKLDASGVPTEGWDGTFKGVPAPQGVYVWQASAKFINGSDWKGMSYSSSLPRRVGVIHLIR